MFSHLYLNYLAQSTILIPIFCIPIIFPNFASPLHSKAKRNYMTTLYLCFANSDASPLPTLRDEQRDIKQALLKGASAGHFYVLEEAFATTNAVVNALQQIRPNLAIFHYSGHAGKDRLELGAAAAYAEGLAQLFSKCPQLQLVLLNGCSTLGQVKALHEAGVPLVIATSAPIDDRKAATFGARFYKALGENQSIREAYELAKAEILTIDNKINFTETRSIGFTGEQEGKAGEATWGMFTKPGGEAAEDWRLPTVRPIQGDVPKPNQRLYAAFIPALAPFSPEAQKILNDEDMGQETDEVTRREVILKSLPHPVSEQIRKLIAPDAGNTTDTFFDRYTTSRLEQCVVAYSTIIELLMYVMLAQLWDEMVNKKVTALPAVEANELRRYFTMPKTERAKYSLRNVVRAVRQVFDNNNIPYFVEELQPVAAYAADDNHPFAKACVFFESVRLKLASGTVEDQEGEYLAIEAEAELCAFIKPLGFLAKYGMDSIKDISIYKNRFYPTAKYQHKMTKLEQRFVGLANTVERYDEFIENASVIITNGKRHLNLSPFVIDENAFNDKAAIDKILYFDYFDKNNKQLTFKHVYKPAVMPLVVQEGETEVGRKVLHREILGQLNAFSQLLFQQNLENL
jgi:hypothetical protein